MITLDDAIFPVLPEGLSERHGKGEGEEIRIYELRLLVDDNEMMRFSSFFFFKSCMCCLFFVTPILPRPPLHTCVVYIYKIVQRVVDTVGQSS
jgi:hypothetical protein